MPETDYCVTLAYVDDDGNAEELLHMHVVSIHPDVAVAEVMSRAAASNISLARCNAASVVVAINIPENVIEAYDKMRARRHGNLDALPVPASMSSCVH